MLAGNPNISYLQVTPSTHLFISAKKHIKCETKVTGQAVVLMIGSELSWSFKVTCDHDVQCGFFLLCLFPI